MYYSEEFTILFLCYSAGIVWVFHKHWKFQSNERFLVLSLFYRICIWNRRKWLTIFCGHYYVCVNSRLLLNQTFVRLVKETRHLISSFDNLHKNYNAIGSFFHGFWIQLMAWYWTSDSLWNIKHAQTFCFLRSSQKSYINQFFNYVSNKNHYSEFLFLFLHFFHFKLS